MKCPNPLIHPVSAKLFKDLWETELTHDSKLIDQVVGIVLAYEHGEGDVAEVFADLNSDGDTPALRITEDGDEAIRAYAAVAFDLVLAISNL